MARSKSGRSRRRNLIRRRQKRRQKRIKMRFAEVNNSNDETTRSQDDSG